MKTQRLDRTIVTVQQRWGHRALFQGGGRHPTTDLPVLPTGFPPLDDALGTGGLPFGRIVELVGSGTCGHVTLAAGLLARAQRAGHQAIYVDVERQVDLDLLAHRGVSFEELAILRPLNLAHGVEMTRDLLVEGGAGAIVFDRLLAQREGPASGDPELLDRALREWNVLVSRALCLFLCITEVESPSLYPTDISLPYFATVRLGFAWEGWLSAEELGVAALSPRRIAGFRSRVTVLKNKLGPAGRSVSLHMPIVER